MCGVWLKDTKIEYNVRASRHDVYLLSNDHLNEDLLILNEHRPAVDSFYRARQGAGTGRRS